MVDIMEARRSAYLHEHNESGIHINDIVTITHMAKAEERGWNASWVDEMTLFVGKTCRVSHDCGTDGFELSALAPNPPMIAFTFPYFVLQKGSTDNIICISCGIPIHDGTVCSLCCKIHDIHNISEADARKLAERRDFFGWQP